jgi:hypothetical protein
MLISSPSHRISINTIVLEVWNIPFWHIKDCATSLCKKPFVASLFNSVG